MSVFTDPYQDSYPPWLWGGAGGGQAAATVTTLAPSTRAINTPGFTLTVTGTGFVPGCIVRTGAVGVATTYVSATSLTAQVPAEYITGPARTVQVSVLKPDAPGSNSSPFTLTATQEDEPESDQKAEPILLALEDEGEPSQ